MNHRYFTFRVAKLQGGVGAMFPHAFSKTKSKYDANKINKGCGTKATPILAKKNLKSLKDVAQGPLINAEP